MSETPMRPDHPFLAHRAALEARGRVSPWVILFDIDSTLMDTGPRNDAIVRAALDDVPGLAPWRGRLTFGQTAWSPLEPLVQAGVDAAVQADVMAYWRQRFFTDEWLAHDLPYPGAPEFLAALKGQGFRLAYLTGRHSAGMEKGTRASFVRHGLPAGTDEKFFFKPDFAMDDRGFKASVCRDVAALGTLVATVDNEPANVNLFRAEFPEALVVWLDTVMSPRPEPLDDGILTWTPEVLFEP